jgi:hypothetical protein
MIARFKAASVDFEIVCKQARFLSDEGGPLMPPRQRHRATTATLVDQQARCRQLVLPWRVLELLKAVLT